MGLAFLAAAHSLREQVDRHMTATAGPALSRTKVLQVLADRGALHQAELAALRHPDREGLDASAGSPGPAPPRSRRRKTVSLTETGRASLAAAEQCGTHALRRCFDSLEPHQPAARDQLLDHLGTALPAPSPPHAGPWSARVSLPEKEAPVLPGDHRGVVTAAWRPRGNDSRDRTTRDLTAYRILQEALTNVTKHAATPRARVRLTYASHDLTLAVTNDAAPRDAATPPRTDQGFGLVGMRERVLAAGGGFRAGPRAQGGFEVRCTLPLNDDERSAP